MRTLSSLRSLRPWNSPLISSHSSIAFSSATSAASATDAMKLPSSSSAVAMSVAMRLILGPTASSSASQNVFPSTSRTSCTSSALSKEPVRRDPPFASSSLHLAASTYMATPYTLTLMMAIFFSLTPAPMHCIVSPPWGLKVFGNDTFVAGSTMLNARATISLLTLACFENVAREPARERRARTSRRAGETTRAADAGIVIALDIMIEID
mmetsp:Transcript_10747/g.43321  ORF Transcript_10747/g.43321 Transcript_10747/m.43321 type:complete len:210 (-) Transcript_10747:60-689(-)